MKERALRRRCRGLLRQLDVQPPLNVAELCEAYARHRGFPIRVVEHHMPMPGPVGVWIRTNSADYIIYPADTSAPHQNHVILHEIGHVIAGHKGDGHDVDIITEWFPHISPDVVRSSLQRSHYDSEQEQEAEIVATIILEWASVLERVALHSHSSFGKGELERALGDHLGWL